MNAITKPDNAALLERVLMQGDLSKLSPVDRMAYYRTVCDSVGLNPLTRPFDYLNLGGRLVLYAKRDATDQLRKIHGVSIQITAREKMDDLYVITARATDKTGRQDESTGAVTLTGLKGDNLANAVMKCETKAKRRVTLSICGLGMLDETEVTTVRDARPIKVDSETGEILEPVTSIHKPTDGAEDRLSEPQRIKVQGVVEEMQAHMMEDRFDLAAVAAESAGLDADEMVFLWTHFPVAADRRKLKEVAKASREKQAA